MHRHGRGGPVPPWTGNRERAAFGPWRPPFGQFGPGGPGHHHGPRGRRSARRGNIRAAILALLTERPMHGYEVIQQLGERTGGVWQPSPGSVYPTLQLLEDTGLVTSQDVDGRRQFALTEAGRAEAERASAGPAPWDEVTAGVSPDLVKLREAVGGVFAAAQQIMFAGTDAQRQAALGVLGETRRRLYTILAEDGGPADSTVPDDSEE